MWRCAVGKVTKAKQTVESIKCMYKTVETLAEESTKSPEREIVAIERSAGADSRHRESLEYSLGKVNEEDLLPQTKDLNDGVGGIEDVDNRVRRGDPHASPKEALLVYYAECTGAKKIASKSCRQVKVVVAKLVKGNSPDVLSVL